MREIENSLIRREAHEVISWSTIIRNQRLHRNPLFRGEGTPFLLGLLFQVHQGSPHDFGSAEWDRFGRHLVDEFELYLIRSKKYRDINEIQDVLDWQITYEARKFFDERIPIEFRANVTVILSNKTANCV